MDSEADRFYSYSTYLQKRYGRKVYRVAVDAGFSCPNRGPSRASSGCTYCDEFGAQAVYQQGAGEEFFDKNSIGVQIQRGVRFMQGRYDAKDFILYLQAFSNTWAPVEQLKELYDYCLDLHSFLELIVSTRPDCINEKKAALLASYKRDDFDVWVELGLQSAHNDTLKRINRGHGVEEFLRAVRILKKYNIKQTVHVIFGLPGEDWKEIETTLQTIISAGIEGIKIHNLHVTKGAPLYKEYLAGEMTVPSDSRHLAYVIRALEMLPPEMIIHRLTTDTPPDRLSAPRQFWPKSRFYAEVRTALERRDTRQGRLWKPRG